jgi:hypothetical protein
MSYKFKMFLFEGRNFLTQITHIMKVLAPPNRIWRVWWTPTRFYVRFAMSLTLRKRRL